MTALPVFATLIVSAPLCAFLIFALRPLLIRYALARPNARSSHKKPTPQGGGIAVIAAAIAVFAVVRGLLPLPFGGELLTVLIATTFIALVGLLDDLKPIPVVPRLLLQLVAVSAVILAMAVDARTIPSIPFWFERVLLVLAGLWYVNLTNFMDGLDWMTVAEIVPVTAALGAFGWFGYLPHDATMIALALGGALIGFAPFNRPVAKLFLGDVGSLPIGLLTGWCLLQLATSGGFFTALILPLYYLADATITLARRLFNGEAVWDAHRSHFYQRATDNGFSVIKVVTSVFILNIVLAILAALSLQMTSLYGKILLLIFAAGCTAIVLARFSQKLSLQKR
jgi:UDP-N-acetylmuramyl pentapeptide phosphotransferase/UDP-N-acetylglucosamine-1-phosphate transferase